MFFVCFQNRVNGLLDAEIDDLVAVVRQNNIDEVLADVVHVAFHRSQHHHTFRGRAAFLFHEGLEETHRRFHRFR